MEADRALARRDQADHRFQRGRLAGTVAAEQGHDLAFTDHEPDAEQDLRRTIAAVEVGDFQRHAASPWE